MAAKKAAKKSAAKTSKKSVKKSTKKSASKKAAKKTSKKQAAKKTTSKRITKKTAQTSSAAQPTQKQPFPTIAVISGILFVAIVILGAALLTMWLTQDSAPEVEQNIVAIVNGQAITQEEVAIIQQALGPQAAAFSEQDLVDQLILQTLLLQEAELRGISVSREAAEEEFSQLLAAQGISQEEFGAILAQQGQDLHLLLEEFRKNLVLEQLAESLVTQEVTEQEAREFYQEYAAIAGEDTPTYEELEEEIYSFLEEQQRAQALTELAEQLESEAQIQRY